MVGLQRLVHVHTVRQPRTIGPDLPSHHQVEGNHERCLKIISGCPDSCTVPLFNCNGEKLSIEKDDGQRQI